MIRSGSDSYAGYTVKQGKNLFPEQYDDRHDRAELYHDLKHRPEAGRHVVEADKFLEQYQMTGARDRQPFGDSFDYAEDY